MEFIQNWWHWLFGVSSENLLPHERYPAILDWRKGDDIYDQGNTYIFIACNEKGDVFVQHFANKFRFDIELVSRRMVNRSLQNRKIDAELKESSEYMELLAEFQKAVKELQERDRRLGVAE